MSTGAALVAAACSEACGLKGMPRGNDPARITAHLPERAQTTAEGEHRLGLEPGRDAVLRLPPKPSSDPMPLLVLLHGAGSSGETMLRRTSTASDDAGVAVLAPDSRGQTWDAIRWGFGSDVTFIGRALERVFATVSVDRTRVAVGGFSDGATYALSLGLVNGDLFHRILAFSPGFIVDGTPHGQPRVFVSHGTADDILPIDRCGRVVVAGLRKRGYDVTYREFDGGHEMPPAVLSEGMTWIAAS
jgi:phospholipase/carboxylesterase